MVLKTTLVTITICRYNVIRIMDGPKQNDRKITLNGRYIPELNLVKECLCFDAIKQSCKQYAHSANQMIISFKRFYDNSRPHCQGVSRYAV